MSISPFVHSFISYFRVLCSSVFPILSGRFRFIQIQVQVSRRNWRRDGMHLVCSKVRKVSVSPRFRFIIHVLTFKRLSVTRGTVEHNNAVEELKQAQIQWASDRQVILDIINKRFVDEQHAERAFQDVDSAMRAYKDVGLYGTIHL